MKKWLMPVFHGVHVRWKPLTFCVSVVMAEFVKVALRPTNTTWSVGHFLEMFHACVLRFDCSILALLALY